MLVAERGASLSLANAMGVPNNTLYAWLHGSEPGRDNLVKLARATGVSLAWLIAGEGEMRPDRPPSGYKLPACDRDLAPPPLAFSERYFDYLVDLAPSKNTPPFLMRVIDDAMVPTLLPDDLVVVDITQLDNLRPLPPVGIWFLVGVGFRRIEFRREVEQQVGQWVATISPDNPKYGSEKRVLRPDELDRLGRVVWRAGRL